MLPDLNKVKGIHPGAILKRELKKRNIKSIQLAKAIDEYPQTINAITKERRGINPKLSIKLGIFFNSNNDYFMLLQASYDVQKIAKESQHHDYSLVGKFRKSIFWDTEIENIDWTKNKKAVIKRILERGNKSEIEELIKFYGMDTIKQEIKHITNTFSTKYEQNVKEYIMNAQDR